MTLVILAVTFILKLAVLDVILKYPILTLSQTPQSSPKDIYKLNQLNVHVFRKKSYMLFCFSLGSIKIENIKFYFLDDVSLW